MQRRQSDVAVTGIEQTTYLAATGLHALRQTSSRDIPRLHGFANLPGENFLDGDSLEFIELALAFEEIVEGSQVWPAMRVSGKADENRGPRYKRA